MSSKIAKLAESNHIIIREGIKVDSGHGTLPSLCPECNGALDFNKLGLICRDCKHQIVLD